MAVIRIRPSYFLLLCVVVFSSLQGVRGQASAKPKAELVILNVDFATSSFGVSGQLNRGIVTEGRVDAGGIPKGDSDFRAEFGWPVARGTPFLIPSEDHQSFQSQLRHSSRVAGIRVDHVLVEVRNDAPKTIRSIDWEFTYPHFEGDLEVVFLEARTGVKIPPGETTRLSHWLPHDGCRIGIRVLDLGRDVQLFGRVCGNRSAPRRTGIYRLEARIKRIEYADGTAWRDGVSDPDS